MLDVSGNKLTDTPPMFAGWEPVKKLGTGAASTIYQVRNVETGQMRALKYVMRKDGEDKRMIDQVEAEFDVASKIDHPYIRKVYEIKRIRKMLACREVIMLMEFCPGISLEQGPSHSLLDLLLVFRMVANAIHGMHQAGFIHCDLKPNNIIIAENGGIKVIDLGQSCAVGTVKTRIQGTPDYIAPEQVKRRPLSRQTDIFNLGATIYWALTGKNIPTMIPKHQTAGSITVEKNVPPPPSPNELKPKIPVGVSNLVMECIRKKPIDRPKDMPEVIARLDLLIHMIASGKSLK
ncbi:MAG: serine/threonine protein kinase [Phycisphaerae bacterium]|nr:serine/threonine protein kinase [Phycisphaerae bacterium]